MYELFETNEFQKSIDKLQKKEASFIRKKLESFVYPQLKDEPHYGKNIKKLRGYSPETWRYRIGNCRVFYTLDEDDNIVLLLVVESRKDAYR
jgi:mRNA interferase RelE/StbE